MVAGHKYEGEWRRDGPQGVGKITYPNGDVYEGQVGLGGVPEGEGRSAGGGACYALGSRSSWSCHGLSYGP